MKKDLSLILLGLALLILSACSQNIDVEDTTNNEISYDDEEIIVCNEPSEEITMYNGEYVTLGDHTITVQEITIGSADIDVDYSSSYISTGSSLIINDVNIEIISTDTDMGTVTLTLALC